MENSTSSGPWAPLQTDSAQSFSHLWLFVASWTVVPQAPLFMEFPRQEFWSGAPFPTPGHLPDPLGWNGMQGMELASLVSPRWQADSLLLAPPGKDWRQEKGMTEDEMVGLKEETEQALPWKQDSSLTRLWTLSYMPNINGNDIPTGKPAPRRKSPRALHA